MNRPWNGVDCTKHEAGPTLIKSRPLWLAAGQPGSQFPAPATTLDRTLIQEILEVVEQAAIASAELTGRGLKNEADEAAVEAMRKRMGQINMQGRIVIGEGER